MSGNGILEQIDAKLNIIMQHLGFQFDGNINALSSVVLQAEPANGTAPAANAVDTQIQQEQQTVPGAQPSNIAGNDAGVTAQATSTTGEVDSAGLPWDERIHSSSKEKVKGDTWKYKRGVDKNLVTQIEGGYRAAGYSDPRAAAGGAVGSTVQNTTPVVDAGANVAGQTVGAGAGQQTAVVETAPAGGLPGVGGIALPGAVVQQPAPVKVEMPAYQAGVEITDSLLTTIAAAFYAEYGEANLRRVLTELFKLTPDAPVTAIAAPEHRDSFWRLVTTQQYLDHYQIVKPA